MLTGWFEVELFYNGRLGIGSFCFKMTGLEKQLKRETKEKFEKSGYEEATRDVKKNEFDPRFMVKLLLQREGLVRK